MGSPACRLLGPTVEPTGKEELNENPWPTTLLVGHSDRSGGQTRAYRNRVPVYPKQPQRPFERRSFSMPEDARYWRYEEHVEIHDAEFDAIPEYVIQGHFKARERAVGTQ